MPGAIQQFQTIHNQPHGKIEQLTLYLCETFTTNDVILVDTTNAPPLWYYFYRYEIPDVGLFPGRDQPFRQAYVIVDESNKESFDTVVERQNFADRIDSSLIQTVYSKGKLSVYRVQPTAEYSMINIPENALLPTSNCP